MARRSLRGRLAGWLALSTALALVVAAIVAVVVVTLEEEGEGEAGAAEETPAEAAAELRAEVITAMAIAAPIGIALAIGGALWVTRRALAPVDRVIAEASAISAADLDRRLAIPTRDDELRALVVALNGLLARVERGYQAVSSFAGDASHELRTPIAVIVSELEIALRRDRSAAEWQASARSSLDELQRLTRLVDALLRLARADAAAPVAPVDLAAIVEQVVAQHAAAAATAGVTLTAEPGATVALDGDPDALATALSNLVGNAIRYTPRGGAIAVRVADDRVIVDDTGPGLDASEPASIFAPFARGAQGRAADARGDEPGFGLGLAISRRIAERHGGTVSAENRAGGGARFTLSLRP